VAEGKEKYLEMKEFYNMKNIFLTEVDVHKKLPQFI